LPLHSAECPDFDGKRCSHTGFRPDYFCLPVLSADRKELAALRDRVAELEARNASMHAARDTGLDYPCGACKHGPDAGDNSPCKTCTDGDHFEAT
jgi:hypothetical protein